MNLSKAATPPFYVSYTISISKLSKIVIIEKKFNGIFANRLKQPLKTRANINPKFKKLQSPGN